MKNFFITIAELLVVYLVIILIKYLSDWDFNDRELLILFFALYMQLQIVTLRSRVNTEVNNYYIDANETKEEDEAKSN